MPRLSTFARELLKTTPRRKPEPEPPPRSPSWFWWLLANALAACFAVLSWVGCLWLFQHPEEPTNYRLLKKLGRAPEIQRFTALDAPPGNSAQPPSLYRRFFSLTPDETTALNRQFLRNYLGNLTKPTLVTYIEGDFRVLRARPLGNADLFHPGFVVRAQALVKPREDRTAAPYPLLVDYLFPADHPEAVHWFSPGDLFTIRKVPNCAAVLHAARFDEGDEPALCLTVVPVACGEYEAGTGRKFTIEPPSGLNPAAQFPPLGTEKNLMLPE